MKILTFLFVYVFQNPNVLVIEAELIKILILFCCQNNLALLLASRISYHLSLYDISQENFRYYYYYCSRMLKLMLW